jgi:hypothetical protein
MIKKNKKLAAAILAAALALSSVSVAFAAGSPTTDTPIPGKQEVDPTNKNSTAEVNVNPGTGITATQVANVTNAIVGGYVSVPTADGKTVDLPVDTLGTNAFKGNDATKKLTTNTTVTRYRKHVLKGSKVKTVVAKIKDKNTLTLGSKSLADSNITSFEAKGTGTISFGWKTFSGTKIKNITVKSGKVILNQGSFLGVKNGTRTYIQMTGLKNANKLDVSVGAFSRSSRNMTIRFSTKMSVKEYKKAVKKLRNGGFKGKIVRSKKSLQ